MLTNVYPQTTSAEQPNGIIKECIGSFIRILQHASGLKTPRQTHRHMLQNRLTWGYNGRYGELEVPLISSTSHMLSAVCSVVSHTKSWGVLNIFENIFKAAIALSDLN